MYICGCNHKKLINDRKGYMLYFDSILKLKI